MTPVTPVTLVTRDATLDELSATDYRDIYDELRGRDPVFPTGVGVNRRRAARGRLGGSVPHRRGGEPS